MVSLTNTSKSSNRRRNGAAASAESWLRRMLRLETQAREVLADLIVQFVGQSLALCLLRLDQLAREHLELFTACPHLFVQARVHNGLAGMVCQGPQQGELVDSELARTVGGENAHGPNQHVVAAQSHRRRGGRIQRGQQAVVGGRGRQRGARAPRRTEGVAAQICGHPTSAA